MKAVIDIETGGFHRDAGIVEIAMIVIDDNDEIKHEYSAIVQQYFIEGTEELAIYEQKAVNIHGITANDQDKLGKDPREVVKELEAIIQDYNVMEFIGHNIKSFDAPRLERFFAQFSKYDADSYFPWLIDTKHLTQESYVMSSYSLQNICEYFGIINEDAHRALSDCKTTLELYKIL